MGDLPHFDCIHELDGIRPVIRGGDAYSSILAYYPKILTSNSQIQDIIEKTQHTLSGGSKNTLGTLKSLGWRLTMLGQGCYSRARLREWKTEVGT